MLEIKMLQACTKENQALAGFEVSTANSEILEYIVRPACGLEWNRCLLGFHKAIFFNPSKHTAIMNGYHIS